MGYTGLGVLKVCYWLVMVPALCVLVFLGAIAGFVGTRWFCGAFILALMIPLFLFHFAKYGAGLKTLIFGGITVVGSVVFLVANFVITADGSYSKDATVRSIFLDEPAYKRASLANLVPEIDQLKLGSYLTPYLDPVIDKPQSQRLRSLFMKVYREMRKDPECLRMGSVMNYGYRDLLMSSRPAKHFYLIVPKAVRGKSVPLIVFLHGSGGNFKGNLWCWKKYAEEHGVVVLLPSFGFGFWDRSGADEVLKESLAYCEASTDFKVSSKVLMGVSNGGVGAYRFGKSLAEEFDALALLSPVMYSSETSDQSLAETWEGRSVLVISGSDDRRIPRAYIERNSRNLASGGVDLQLEFIDDEDHFLMYSDWDRVSSIFSEWMSRL